jgi:hypothetical protein
MMGVSGVLLWADNFVLSYFPKGLLDVAGVFLYYEAVLAALAILVWHFYSVIFDPSVYPMNLAWLTGFGPAREHSAPGGTRPPGETSAPRAKLQPAPISATPTKTSGPGMKPAVESAAEPGSAKENL